MTPPNLTSDPAGGVVVVTRFRCPSLRVVLAIRLLHALLRADVRERATGFVGVRTLTDWRHRTVFNISLWNDLDSVYTIGNVPRHLVVVRLTRKLEASTKCGVFCFAGNCQQLMFNSPGPAGSPLGTDD